jgi:acetyltransferase-like isoleucine patch superfamily enzyme
VTPLAHPPIGRPRRPPVSPLTLDEEGALPPSSRNSRPPVSRFLEEAQRCIAEMDPGRVAWNAVRVLPDFSFPSTRARLLAMLGCDIRRGSAVLGHVRLVGPRGSARNLHIGPGTIIGPDVTLGLDAPITIGKNVSLGPRAVLYTATHPLGAGPRRMLLGVSARPIIVDDGAWVGLGAIILCGVRIGRGSVVAAGAVVNEDVPDDVLVAGNPAEIVEDLPASR